MTCFFHSPFLSVKPVFFLFPFRLKRSKLLSFFFWSSLLAAAPSTEPVPSNSEWQGHTQAAPLCFWCLLLRYSAPHSTYLQQTQQTPAIIGSHNTEGWLGFAKHLSWKKACGPLFFFFFYFFYPFHDWKHSKMFFSPDTRKQETAAALMYNCGAAVYIRR